MSAERARRLAGVRTSRARVRLRGVTPPAVRLVDGPASCPLPERRETSAASSGCPLRAHPVPSLEWTWAARSSPLRAGSSARRASRPSGWAMDRDTTARCVRGDRGRPLTAASQRPAERRPASRWLSAVGAAPPAGYLPEIEAVQLVFLLPGRVLPALPIRRVRVGGRVPFCRWLPDFPRRSPSSSPLSRGCSPNTVR
jgi:hypothetical protein